ncbi:MAG TPA: glycosyltransferase family A protein [Bacteroidota bacterium]|nr:glycosyltransferase family A protein [Bacteroidota bacterium]
MSIVLCSYNRRDLIARAIRSVLSQTYANWQLIVVDDGSDDGTGTEVISSWSAERRILYTWHDNRGLALSRNVGIQLSRGRYVTFIDSDDEFAPTHVEKRVAYLGSHPDIDLVFGGFRLHGPRARQYVPDVERPGRMIHLSKCDPGSTIFARRRCLQELGGFRELNFAEDHDLFARAREKFRLRRVRYPTYIYHVDSTNRLCDVYGRGGEQGILEYRKSLLAPLPHD